MEESEDLLSLLALHLSYLIVQQHHLLRLHEERLTGRRLLVYDTADVALIAGVDRQEEATIAHHGGGISIDPALLSSMAEDPLHRSPKRTLERADRSTDTPQLVRCAIGYLPVVADQPVKLQSQLLQWLQSPNQSVEQRVVLRLILREQIGGVCSGIQHLAECAQLLRL